MANNPFQQLDVIRNASRKGKRITDCYRLMYKKDLWVKAYNSLYPTADFHEQELVSQIIDQLKKGSFRFTLLNKNSSLSSDRNGNFHFQDRLTLEVITMILENVYEPIFSDCSHGYRKGRSYHTALLQVKNSWREFTWCLKGDFQLSVDSMDHAVLLKLLAKKIKDHRFLLLIHNMLTTGILHDLHKKGSPAPLLTNIYFHEFDLFMEKLMKEVNNRIETENTPKKFSQIDSELEQIKQHDMDEEFDEQSLISSRHLKSSYIKYIRHGSEFVIGMAASKQRAIHINEAMRNFLRDELQLQPHDIQLLLTHLEKPVPFLGYQLKSVNKRNPLKKQIRQIRLEIPKAKINEVARSNGYGNVDNFTIIHREKLINHSEIDILNTYNSELHEIADYYKLADNFHELRRLFYLAESSFIKTIACKRKSTSMKVVKSMRTHKQGALCLVKKNEQGHETLHAFLKLGCVKGRS